MAKDYLATFLSHQSSGVQCANTICVHDDELGGPSSPSDRVDDVSTWLTTKYRALLPTSSVLDVLRLFQIPDTYGDDSVSVDKLIGSAGTLAGADGVLPREVCLTLSLRSNHTSRRSQGRIEIPSPLNSGCLDSSANWKTDTAYWTNIGTFADALLAGHDLGILGADGHLSTRVYSRRQHQEGKDPKTVDVDSYTRRPRPRWLRRRVSIP